MQGSIRHWNTAINRWATKSRSSSSRLASLLPFIVGTGVLVASLGLWQVGTLYEQEQIQRKANLAADAARNELQAGINTRIIALYQLIYPWDQFRQLKQAERQDALETYRRFYPACQMIQWIDASFQVRWTVSPFALPGPTGELHRSLVANQTKNRNEIIVHRHNSTE